MRLTAGITGRRTFWLLSYVLLSLIFLCSEAAAAQKSSSSPKETGPPAEYTALKQSIQSTLQAEKSSLKQLHEQLSQARQLQKKVSQELDTHKIQLSANQNLLQLSTARIEDLQKAQATNQTALDHIGNRLSELSQKQGDIEKQLQETEKQYAHDQNQLSTIKTQSHGGKTPTELLKQLDGLIRLLDIKRNLLGQIDGIYGGLIGQLKEMQQSFQELAKSFAHKIHARERQELFERKTGLLSKKGWLELRQELGRRS